jgi:hypothetical protein
MIDSIAIDSNATVEMRPNKTKGGRAYAIILMAMAIALVASLASYIVILYPPTRGTTFSKALPVLLSIEMLFQPVPHVIWAQLIKVHFTAFIFPLLYWLQIALLIRRVAVCIGNRKITPPSMLNGWWLAPMFIGLFSWILGALIYLSPILFLALGQKNAALAIQMGNVLLTGFVHIPAANLFGITFFVLELLSIKRDGLFPRSNPGVQPTPPNGRG